MQKDLTFKIAVISTILIGMLVPIYPVAAKDRISYSFNFVGPSVTMRAWDLPPIVIPPIMDVEPGSYMIVTGAGTFDPSTGAASGGGAFTHYNYDGALYCKGIWKIESFVSFDSGLLIIIVKWTREWSPIPGYPKMVIGSGPLEINNNGWFGPIFDEIVSGHVFFHLNG